MKGILGSNPLCPLSFLVRNEVLNQSGEGGYWGIEAWDLVEITRAGKEKYQKGSL